MKLRVLRKNVFVSKSAMAGWNNDSIDRTQDILQQWDDKEGWVNVPVTVEHTNVFKDSLEAVIY